MTHATLPVPSILAGFSEPVAQSQATFRAALNALAHPGRVQSIPAEGATHPERFSPALTALLLTLVDQDTPVWLPEGVGADAQRYLRFHCGCPLVSNPSDARFLVGPLGFEWPALAACEAGDPAYPDRSATLLLEVQSLTEGPAVTLSGPGIADRYTLSIAGLPAGFWEQWQANHHRFPLGVDVFFIQGAQFCALPRTTRVQEI